MTIRFPSPAITLFLGATTVMGRHGNPEWFTYAPEWTPSLPFTAYFVGEVVKESSNPGGETVDSSYQDALLGVASSSLDNSAGSAWHWIKNEFRNEYEVTHFDGAGGAIRMAAKQCPPPDAYSGEQSYDDPAGVLSPCQCSIDITPAPLEGCTLPTKFSCLPWGDICVPTEDNGCPLSEFVQRREWNYAPPICAIRPPDSPPDMFFGTSVDFMVCESHGGLSSQIEAVYPDDEEGLLGVPAYDIEVSGTMTHQSSSKTSSYLVNRGTDSTLPSDYTFFLDDSEAFLGCLSASAAADASKIFCNGRGVWEASPGNQPFPFSCNCDDPQTWTGDRCDVQMCPNCHEGTSGPCRHNSAGDTSCTNTNPDGTCPTGYSLCFP